MGGETIPGAAEVTAREAKPSLRTMAGGLGPPSETGRVTWLGHASTLVEISRLVRDDYLVEIEATAVLPEPRRSPARAAARRARPTRKRRKT